MWKVPWRGNRTQYERDGLWSQHGVQFLLYPSSHLLWHITETVEALFSLICLGNNQPLWFGETQSQELN